MRRVLLFVFAAAVLVCGAALLLNNSQWLGSFFARSSSQADSQRAFLAADETSNAVLTALNSPRFNGKEIRSLVLGQASLEFFDESRMFFLHPKAEMSELAKTFSRFCEDVSLAGIIDGSAGEVDLGGGISLVLDPQREMVLSMPVKNFKVPPDMPLELVYGPVSYRITPSVIRDYKSNEVIYGGSLHVVRSRESRTLVRTFMNHGAMVSRPNEPSLAALVSDLTASAATSDDGAREQRIQLLVDFVCGSIVYSDIEAEWYQVETLKRALEVLISRTSDCSGKAILLASMLEQLGEDYLLCYYPEHISVAVPIGRFPRRNGLTFEWQGTSWVRCETAVRGQARFRVGADELDGAVRGEIPTYIQRPRDGAVIETASGRALEFL